MSIESIPPFDRIVVARVPDGWVCVLQPGAVIRDQPEAWRQAVANCQDLRADPLTCQIVDRRLPQWAQVARDTDRMISLRILRQQMEAEERA